MATPRSMMLALFAAGVVALVTKKFGLRTALALGGAAVGLHLLVDQRRKRGRPGPRNGDMSLNGGSVVLIRGVDGRISRVSRAHLALMMREGDFTADDYELLLRLDDEVTKPACDAADKLIASLPTCTYGKAASAAEDDPCVDCAQGVAEAGTSASTKRSSCECCAICLFDFENGDGVATLPCSHLFHTDCISSWLRQKPRCPVCVALVE